MHTNNCSNIAIFDKVIAKIKWCNFFAAHCTGICDDVGRCSIYENVQLFVWSKTSILIFEYQHI